MSKYILNLIRDRVERIVAWNAARLDKSPELTSDYLTARDPTPGRHRLYSGGYQPLTTGSGAMPPAPRTLPTGPNKPELVQIKMLEEFRLMHATLARIEALLDSINSRVG